MRYSIALIVVMLLLAPVAGYAEQPNIEPGQWEYKNTTSFSGDMPGASEQSQTTTQCVTQEDIDDGMLALDQKMEQQCEIRDKNIGRNSASYTMVCNFGMGGGMTMSADMQFNGDTSQGTMTGEMDSEMGKMEITTKMQGKRIGDC